MSEEQEKTAAELQEREKIAKELKEEKKMLEDVTSNLKGDLTVRYNSHTRCGWAHSDRIVIFLRNSYV